MMNYHKKHSYDNEGNFPYGSGRCLMKLITPAATVLTVFLLTVVLLTGCQSLDNADKVFESSEVNTSSELVFTESNIDSFATALSFSAEFITTFNDSEDIASIWGNETLTWLPQSSHENGRWYGSIAFNTDGQVRRLDISYQESAEPAAESSVDSSTDQTTDLSSDLAAGPSDAPSTTQTQPDFIWCSLSLSSTGENAEMFHPEDDNPTCTLWETPVIATHLSNIASGNDTLSANSVYCLKFNKTGAENISVTANFFIPEGKELSIQKLAANFVSQCLNPDNVFQLSHLRDKYYKDWRQDAAFTTYIPQVPENYELTYETHRLDDTGDFLQLMYENHTETQVRYIVWLITKNAENVTTVDISDPQSYDLRLYENPDPNLDSFGLTGQFPEKYNEMLIHPVFAKEDLAKNIIDSRIIPDNPQRYPTVNFLFSVLYPDNTRISYGGNANSADVLKMFQALPLS